MRVLGVLLQSHEVDGDRALVAAPIAVLVVVAREDLVIALEISALSA